MYPEPSVPETRKEPGEKRSRRRRKANKADERRTGLYLASIDRSIDVCAALDRPMFGLLMTEDFCWQSTVAEWRNRRPSRTHRSEWKAWQAEGVEIEAKKGRIREMAAELGLVTRDA